MKLIKLAIIPTLLLFGACHKTKDAGPAEKALDNAIAAYADSVKSNEAELQKSQKDVDSLTLLGNQLFNEFTYVDNPRLVEGYTIQKGVAYPLKSSGMVARITKNEGFELIVANVGNQFTKIMVTCGALSRTSANVPQDQALNYRMGNMSTVAFSGQQADSIGALIYGHRNENVELSLLNVNSRVAATSLSQRQKENIALTWQLFDVRRRIKILEHRIPLLAKKSMTYSMQLQQLKERQTQKSDQTN